MRQLAARIRKKKGIVKATAWTKRANNHSRMKGSVDAKKRSVGDFVKHLSGMGIKARYGEIWGDVGGDVGEIKHLSGMGIQADASPSAMPNLTQPSP